MEMDVHADKKMVCVWLTNEDQKNPAVQAQLKPLYKQYQEKKYTVAVFHSGQDDLEDITRSLLVYNKRRTEELKMKKEKQEELLLN